MQVLSSAAQSRPPTLAIDAVPAAELLMSLCVFSSPSMYEKLGAVNDQLAGMRAGIAPDLLDAVGAFGSGCAALLWGNLLPRAWAASAPRDAAAFLDAIAASDATELRLDLLGYGMYPFAVAPDLIRQALEGDAAARQAVLDALFPDDPAGQAALGAFLDLPPDAAKARIADLLRRWHAEVFAPLEADTAPVLARDAEAKRALQATAPLERIFEVATNGIEYVPETGVRRIILMPSLLLRPFTVYGTEHGAKFVCYPVADESLSVDRGTPPPQLVDLFKALGDERRLRILHRLAGGSCSLQELADHLGIAKSTIHHHLVLLRTARLVRVRTDPDVRYSLREQDTPDPTALLRHYLRDAAPQAAPAAIPSRDG